MPIAGQPAQIEFVGDYHIPANIDHDMAGASADSEATIPATDEDIQMMLNPQVIGNPMILCEEAREVLTLSERMQ
eukprot:2701412-Pyramimonas_sp.AAC.1